MDREHPLRRTVTDRGFLLALVVSLVVRIVPLAIWPEEACVRDGCSYTRLAERIAAGEGMTAFAGWLWAPGYPTWLAIHKVLTGYASPAKGTQIAVSALILYQIWRLGTVMGSRRTALWAVWLYALSPALVYYTISLWSETVYTALLLGTFLALHNARGERDPTLWSGVLGAMAGILLLFRGVALYMVPMWILGLVWDRWRDARSWARGALVVFMAVIAVGPYSVMISQRYDHFIVTDRTLGQMMWLGNNEFSPITFDYGGPLSERQYDLQTSIGRVPCAPRDEAVTRDVCQAEEGWEWVAENPGRFLVRVPMRVAQMVTPHSLLTRHLRWGYWQGLPVWIEEFIVVWGAVMSAGVMLLGAFGAAIRARGALGVTAVLIMLYNLAAVGALAGISRYRAPLMPLLMVYAGLLITEPGAVREAWKAAPWRVIAGVCAVLTLLPLIAWYLPSGWHQWRHW